MRRLGGSLVCLVVLAACSPSMVATEDAAVLDSATVDVASADAPNIDAAEPLSGQVQFLHTL